VDLVHYHALGPGLLAGLPRWLRGRPTVVTVHGLDWQRDKWGVAARQILKLGETASVRWPSRTIVVSKALRSHYLANHKEATTYIPNGIVPPVYRSAELIRQAGITGPYVLFVGRLVPEKGCHLLLEAWRGLPAELRSCYQLVIAGDGGFTSGYVERLKEAAPSGVHFLGYVHGQVLEELFSGADLMVLPSTLEGLSITLLEGMSYQRCCLVSDIPPNVEAAGGNAVLFASGDASDLGRQLAATLVDEPLRQRLGAAGQIHVIEHYSWNRVAGMTADLYREILGLSADFHQNSV
jgi:glycosyltransferase involved in cell wall biosynthesis